VVVEGVPSRLSVGKGVGMAGEPTGTRASEIEVSAEAVETAAGLGAVVREVAAVGGLPFGADPGDFLAALERLAAADEGVDAEPGEAVLP